MRIATLDLTPEMFVSFCLASKDGPPRRFRVLKNPLPDDAKVVEVRLSDPYLPRTLKLVIESESFADVQEGADLPRLPDVWYETVYDEVTEAGA